MTRREALKAISAAIAAAVAGLPAVDAAVVQRTTPPAGTMIYWSDEGFLYWFDAAIEKWCYVGEVTSQEGNVLHVR